MKKIFTLFLSLFLLNSYSQIEFEKGYIINNSGEKKACIIKNIDWHNNPTKINYKLSENDNIRTATIKDIEEFGIGNHLKFIRATVDLDKSSENLNYISENRKPTFEKETIFLKTLVEGKASLYKYTKGLLQRYFFKLDNQPIKPLVYKLYLIEDQLRKNEYFKQQIYNNLRCSAITKEKLKKIDYIQKDLVKIFVAFNRCSNSQYKNFVPKNKKDRFNLYAKIGLNSSLLSIDNSIANENKFDFDRQYVFKIGLEIEYILPFNKNKWGIILGPNYQHYKSKKIKKTISISGNQSIISNVNYHSLEIPVGIRYYMFLNNHSKLFINALYIKDFSINSSITFSRKDGSYLNEIEIGSWKNLAFGLGYNYNKFSFELRLETPRNILINYIYWNSDYKTISVIMSYKLFDF